MKKFVFLMLLGMVLLAGSAFAFPAASGTQASVDPRFPNSTKTAAANAEAVVVRNADLSISCTQDLLFGNIQATAAAGTITISPAGAKSATGGASAYSNTGNIAAAAFTVKGDANSMFAVTLPNDTDCSLSATTNLADGHYQTTGASMKVTTFKFTSNTDVTNGNDVDLTQNSEDHHDQDHVVYFGSNGDADLKIGATLNVGASQLPGYYQGNFNVSVAYY